VADLSQSSARDTDNANAALWLDIARKRNGLPSQLPERANALDMSKWPAPIIRLFLGEITWEAVLAAADDADPKKKKGQVCEANFFIGELALQKGTREEARRRFELAAADCPKTFGEWQAANVELRAMDTNP
jgi:lipoprotein NlpI